MRYKTELTNKRGEFVPHKYTKWGAFIFHAYPPNDHYVRNSAMFQKYCIYTELGLFLFHLFHVNFASSFVQRLQIIAHIFRRLLRKITVSCRLIDFAKFHEILINWNLIRCGASTDWMQRVSSRRVASRENIHVNIIKNSPIEPEESCSGNVATINPAFRRRISAGTSGCSLSRSITIVAEPHNLITAEVRRHPLSRGRLTSSAQTGESQSANRTRDTRSCLSTAITRPSRDVS